MLSEPVIVTAIIGALWLLVFRLRNRTLPPSLGKVDLQSPGIFILAFAVNIALALLATRKFAFVPVIFPYVYISSFGILLCAVFRNRHLYGMRVAAVGIMLNLLVITANFGHMPADPGQAERTGKTYLLHWKHYPRSRPITEKTRLPFLGDIFAFAKPYPLPQIFSVGDIVLTLGACWLVLGLLGLVPSGVERRQKEADVVEAEEDVLTTVS